MFDHSWKGQERRVMMFGTGKGAITARRYFEWDTPHRIVGHVVDKEFAGEPTFDGFPVFTMEEAVERFPASRCPCLRPARRRPDEWLAR